MNFYNIKLLLKALLTGRGPPALDKEVFWSIRLLFFKTVFNSQKKIHLPLKAKSNHLKDEN